MPIFRKISKWVAWVCISILCLMVVMILLGRYYFSPRIDQWRPQVIEWLQKNAHPQFSLGELSLDWQYWTPSLHLQQLALGPSGTFAQVDHLTLELDIFSSLLNLQPHIQKVNVKGASVVIERNALGEVRVGGKVLSSQNDTLKATPIQAESITELLLPWLDWGFERVPRDIQVQEGHIIWRDQYQDNRPDLSFAPVNLHAKHNQQQLDLQLKVSIAEVASSAMALNAHFNRSGSGELKVDWQNWQPQHLKKWLHFPLFMKKGTIEEANISVSFEELELKKFSTRWVLKDFQFLEKNDEDNGLVLQGDKITIAINSNKGLEYPYHFDINTHQLYVQAKDFFRHPMDFNQVQMQGLYRLNEHQKTHLTFDIFKAQLPYGSLDVVGTWDAHPESDNGFIQLQGMIHRMELNKLPHYLPKAIAAESLDWLEKAFLKGYIENAQVRVQGNVDHIPFGLRPESGDFQIQGPVKDVGLHYHQFPAKGNTYWPDIFVPSAEVDFNRGTIRIKGGSLQLDEKYGLSSIQAKNAQVSVQHIEKNALVDIRADIQATGESFLQFYRQSPLRTILSNVLDKSQMAGKVEGKLQIAIPVTDPDSTTVKSLFNLEQSSFQFTPDHPQLTQASGTLKITEKNVQLDNIQARLLGGQAKLSGGIGAKGDRLTIEGNVTAQGLYEFLPLPGIKKRVKGSAYYTAGFDFLGGDYIDVTIKSSLKGLSVDLPQGLSKVSEQTVPLVVRLKAPQQGKAEQLHVDYNNAWLQVVLERANRRLRQFNRGVVSVNAIPVLPSEDMKLIVRSGDWDVMTWLDFVDEFSSSNPSSGNVSLFPMMRYLDMDVDRLSLFGAYINKASLAAQREKDNWTFDVSSPDAKGSVVLSLGKRLVDRIQLNLSQFTLQFSEKEDKGEHVPTRIDLPTIVGDVGRLSWSGRVLGKLTMNSQKSTIDRWDLKQLSLSNEVGTLYATGHLQSSNQMTEADIRLNANALDFGEFLKHFGYEGFLKAGKGQANINLHTDDVSDISLNRLSLKGDMQLDNGALLKVNSSAMKALALISLQSLSNLGNLGNDTPSAFGKGLAFDYLRSNFELKNQSVYIEDFRLNGPLVAIVAAGNTHIPSQNLNFQAAAIPKIEMSGAAVLTGIIVNPVVGLGAFLSQWLLSEPLNRALTAYFSVKGTWDNPLINNKPLPSEEDLKEKRKQQELDKFYRN